jgi:hypothetical protein
MQTLCERYEAKIEKRGPDECWPWTGAVITSTGYASGRRPVIRRDGHTVVASRVGWELEHGEAPPRRLYVLHRCDDPVCMNPAHWFLGTAAENTADMLKKGRHRAAPRKTTPEQDEEIRRLISQGASQTAIARQFGVTRIVIARILGLNWASPAGPAKAILEDMRSADQVA